MEIIGSFETDHWSELSVQIGHTGIRLITAHSFAIRSTTFQKAKITDSTFYVHDLQQNLKWLLKKTYIKLSEQSTSRS